MTATTTATTENNNRSLSDEYPIENSYDPLKDNEFTPVIKKLENSGRYTPKQLQTYGVLTKYLGKTRKNLIYPKIKTIAADACCCYETARSAIAKFEKDFVIYTQRKSNGKIYYFVPILSDGLPDEKSGEYQFARAISTQRDLEKTKLRSRKTLDQMPKNSRSPDHEKTAKNKPLEFCLNPIEHGFDGKSSAAKTLARARVYNKKDNKQINKKSEAPPETIEKTSSKSVKPDGFDGSNNILSEVRQVRQKLTDRVSRFIKTALIMDGIFKHGLAFMLWLAVRCQQAENPVAMFSDGIRNRENYNEFDRKVVREGEAYAAEQSAQHKQDLEKMSEALQAGPSAGPKFDFEASRVSFLETVSFDEFLFNRFKNMTEKQLSNSKEFKNFLRG